MPARKSRKPTSKIKTKRIAKVKIVKTPTTELKQKLRELLKKKSMIKKKLEKAKKAKMKQRGKSRARTKKRK